MTRRIVIIVHGPDEEVHFAVMLVRAVMDLADVRFTLVVEAPEHQSN